MRALWRGRTQPDYLTDALTLLAGWTREGKHLQRILTLDEAQHAALTERVKILADVLHLRPEIRRLDGRTQIRVGPGQGDTLTDGEVTLAARIEAAYRTVTGTDGRTPDDPAVGDRRH